MALELQAPANLGIGIGFYHKGEYMYLTRLSLKNVGPIADLHFDFRFDESGRPIPLVIVGTNGAGKTLTLSVILDALTEGRRSAFSHLPEVEGNNYLKISNKNYIRDRETIAVAECIAKCDKGRLEFLEVVSRQDYPSFQAAHADLVNRFAGTFNQFNETGFYKNAQLSGDGKQGIQQTNFLFFPNFRYEKSAWMSEKVKVEFVRSNNFVGTPKTNPIRTNIIEETRAWLLNCLLDREIYEKLLSPGFSPGQQIFSGYKGPNANCIVLMQDVLLSIFRSKDPTFSSVRIGISQKGDRNFAIIGKRRLGEEFVLAPDVSMLSSGELMTLALASDIVRTWELTKGTAVDTAAKIDGIVVIDEIDLHLHITLQRDVLPSIIKMFPLVQFVVTTHSPFFIIGLKQIIEFDLIELPLGQKIEAEQFSEFREGYDLYIEREKQYRTRFEALRNIVQEDTLPLVITEGKTDWQHLKIALDYAKQEGRLALLEVKFLEFDEDVRMGDARLRQMCEAFADVKQNRKMIFVFDRDVEKIITDMSGGDRGFRNFGNNVFSMCLTVPEHRNGYEKIAIEHLYRDDDLRTYDPASGKRLWFSNEIKIESEPGSDQRKYVAQGSPNQSTEHKKQVFDKEAAKIVDQDGKKVGLSKAAFVQAIIADASVSSNFDRSGLEEVLSVIQKIISSEDD